MEDILHHQGCIKPCRYWDKLPINRCRITCINSSEHPTIYRFGQIIATSREFWGPQKGCELWRGNGYFRKIQVGKILFSPDKNVFLGLGYIPGREIYSPRIQSPCQNHYTTIIGIPTKCGMIIPSMYREFRPWHKYCKKYWTFSDSQSQALHGYLQGAPSRPEG